MAIGIVEVQIYIFFHLSRDHVIKKSSGFEGGVPPLYVTTLPDLMAIGIAEKHI